MNNSTAQPPYSPNSDNQLEPPAMPQQPQQPQNQPQPSIDSNPPMQTSTKPETLAEQNIFNLLGVTDGTSEQREEFLDELQQVIWEDFLEYDVKLLITNEENQELQKILEGEQSKTLEQQEAAVVYLEKLIPELEEIMLEKALELKADLFRERIAGMKEYHSGNQDVLQKISRAEELLSQERWNSAAELLNTVS